MAQFIGENNKLDGVITAVEGNEVVVNVDGGLSARALAVNCGGAGSRTTLSIRPERVSIGGAAPNSAEARVEELIYLGDHIRCRVSVSGHDEFIVKVPNAAGHTHLKVGETTQLTWQTEDCRALDTDQAAA